MILSCSASTQKPVSIVVVMNADAVTQYSGSEHECSNNQLFAILLHEWESKRKVGDAANEFMRQIVACRLEEHLLTWLLQSHANDVVDDIQTLFVTCSDSYLAVNGSEALQTMLDILVTAAILRAAACDRSAENRTRRITEIANMTEGELFMTGKARSVLRSLGKCNMNDEEVDLWTKFLKLPTTLDTRLFNSRRGRNFMDEADQIVSSQQTELGAVRGINGDCAGVEVEGEKKLTANVLWDLAKQLVKLIKAKTNGSDAQYNYCADPDTALHVDVVTNMTELESFLKVKGDSGLHCSNNSSDPVFDDEDAELSAIELLSISCTSSDKKEFISSDVLEKAFDELCAMKQLDVISIQVSFLLGLQMRLKFSLLDRCKSAKDEFERRLRRVFNRLTEKAQDMKHVPMLVILSAFCPRQVVEQCILGARADVVHHNLYLEVLRWSPLLLDWTTGAEHGSKTLLECDLQQAILDVSSNQSNFDRESQNVISFLLSIVGTHISSSKHGASVMTISDLLDKVINPVCYSSGLNIEAQLNMYTLIQQLFQHFVAANTCRDLNRTSLKSSFKLVLGSLCSFNASDLRLGVLVRESLLFILKNIMELMTEPASMIMMEQLDTPLNSVLWTLLSIFDSDLVSDELCKGLRDVTLVESFMQGESIGDSQSVLPLPTVISAIQALLWGILWNTTLPGNLRVTSTKVHTWGLVDAIARYEFLGSDSAPETTPGALLIQSAIAEIMLECGSDLFQALHGKIIPYLLEYEPETFSGDTLGVPKWAADKLSKQPEIELQIPCLLVSTHSIMRYVAKSWAVNAQLATQKNVLLLESLSHVLATQDPAITSSQGSLSGSLFCIQWLCFLESTAHEMHLDKMPAWPTVRTQLELLLLRVLHQLDQLKGISTSEAKFSQCFVAAWLAYLPAAQFDQVFKFVASRTKT